MQTTITARHCEIPDALRDRALQVAERLGSLASRPVDAAVTFEADGLGRRVELRLHDSRGALRGEGRGAGSPHGARSRGGKAAAAAGKGERPAATFAPQPVCLMLRLRDFLTRRGDPLQLEALTGELGLDRQAERRRRHASR